MQDTTQFFNVLTYRAASSFSLYAPRLEALPALDRGCIQDVESGGARCRRIVKTAMLRKLHNKFWPFRLPVATCIYAYVRSHLEQSADCE
jgi:hypothetical protein